MIINAYKPIGISPLDAINLLRKKNLSLADVKITYAGRLDPMAEGVLILLAGEAVYSLDEYIKLDKEYIAEILFGFETDTYDILGVLQDRFHAGFAGAHCTNNALIESVKEKINELKGKISLPFPPYSSYKIKGKQLFTYAREDRLDEITIPIQTTKIYNAKILDSYEITSRDLLERVTENINKVVGDFRQENTLKKWGECLNQEMKRGYSVFKVKFNVSSGTYIRAIAHKIGQDLGCGAILLSLSRTKVGKFDIKDSVRP